MIGQAGGGLQKALINEETEAVLPPNFCNS
jgi:hypothetical protein